MNLIDRTTVNNWFWSQIWDKVNILTYKDNNDVMKFGSNY